MASKKKKTVETIEVRRESITFILKGTTPVILNRMSEKAKREFLLPSQKKTSGDKRTTLKHDPYEEFANSPHRSPYDDDPTLIVMPSTAFKSALRCVAIDVPCASSKAQIGRLTFVEGEYVGIYGLPELRMDIVRQAGINRTPDVRTRATLREWVAILTVTYATPILNKSMIVSLMAHSGWLQGAGDFRPEKGAGNFGSWMLSDKKDPDVKRILKIGRKQQLEAMSNPRLYNAETVELLGWFDAEVERRGLRKA